MTRRFLAGAAVVAVLAGSVSASAQIRTSTYDVISPQLHRSTALTGYLQHARTPEATDRALRTWLVDSAAAAGVPTGLILAAQAAAAPAGARPRLVRAQDDGVVVVVGGSSTLSLSLLQPAGDLNGDGTRDVLDVRYVGANGGSARVLTAARSGSTGRVLWHRTDAMPSGHFIFPIAVAVGSPARPGVVLLDSGFTKANESTIEVTDRFTALVGRTGARIWQHADKGTLQFSDGFSGKHVPSWAGILQMTAGAKDVLLTFSDFEEKDNGSQSGSVSTYRLSGASGVASRSGAVITSSDSVPTVVAMSDVSGDGREDYVALIGGASSSVQARRAIDGTVVWTDTSMTLNPGAWAESAGRLTGARVEDIAVSTGTPLSSLPSVGTPIGDVADPTTPVHGKVGLLRGDTGTVVWQQTGDRSVRLLRAGSPLVPALGVTTSDTNTDVNGTTETLHLMAYDLAGNQLYDQTYTVQAPADSEDNFGFGAAGAWTFGDFGPDGALDGLASMVAFNGSNYRQRTFPFDGATGTALPGDHDALYGSLRGSGDDLVDVTAGSTVLVTALRGRDQKRVFSTRLKPAAPMQRADAYAERVVGRCGDVLVNAAGKSSAYAAVLTANGKVRWSIEHGTKDLRPGAARLGAGGVRPVCAL